MSKITVFEKDNLCIDYRILTRQCAQLSFKDDKVEYFSIATQWGVADTVEDALRNILEADAKYEGKSSLQYALEDLKVLECNLSEEDFNGVIGKWRKAGMVILPDESNDGEIQVIHGNYTDAWADYMNTKTITDEQMKSALKQLEESESVVINVRDKIAQDILSGKGLPKL